MGTTASQTWPYTVLLIPQQGVYELYVSNSPCTHISNMAGTYSTGSELAWNHNLPQGSSRLWERQHPKLGHIRDLIPQWSGYMSYMNQIALGPTDPIWLVHTVWGPNCHKSIICYRDAIDCGNEGTPNLKFFYLQRGQYWLLTTKQTRFDIRCYMSYK